VFVYETKARAKSLRCICPFFIVLLSSHSVEMVWDWNWLECLLNVPMFEVFSRHISSMYSHGWTHTKLCWASGSQVPLKPPQTLGHQLYLEEGVKQLLLLPSHITVIFWTLSMNAIIKGKHLSLLAGHATSLKRKASSISFCLGPKFHCVVLPMSFLQWCSTGATIGHKIDAGCF
jgi:hypothetical protein